jgi:hypothetical protein
MNKVECEVWGYSEMGVEGKVKRGQNRGLIENLKKCENFSKF